MIVVPARMSEKYAATSGWSASTSSGSPAKTSSAARGVVVVGGVVAAEERQVVGTVDELQLVAHAGWPRSRGSSRAGCPAGGRCRRHPAG